MKVFISHSGDRSKALADELHKFIRKLIPSADPWISTGIDKGSRWEAEIAENLEGANVGIVCITSENLDARWLLFEAGALSKSLNGNVCTFLLDVEASAIAPPLSQFQHTRANRVDVWALVKTINERVELAKAKPRDNGDLQEQSDMLWPKLETRIAQLPAHASVSQSPLRTPQEMIAEVLDVVRSIARQLNQPSVLTTNYDEMVDQAVQSWPAGSGKTSALLALMRARNKSGEPEVFSAGEKVLHPKFGEGTIIAVEEMPDERDAKVIVRFDKVGQKTLRARYAGLVKLPFQ